MVIFNYLKVLNKKTVLTAFILCIFSFSLVSCSSNSSSQDSDYQKEKSAIIVTEADLESLLAGGLPVIINFADDSEDSLSTLENFLKLQRNYGEKVKLVSVDLKANPQGKEGFPVQIIPSQFFYTAEGKPINLPGDLGIIMSSFQSVDTQEIVFTIHEGPLSQKEMEKILAYMDVK